MYNPSDIFYSVFLPFFFSASNSSSCGRLMLFFDIISLFIAYIYIHTGFTRLSRCLMMICRIKFECFHSVTGINWSRFVWVSDVCLQCDVIGPRGSTNLFKMVSSSVQDNLMKVWVFSDFVGRLSVFSYAPVEPQVCNSYTLENCVLHQRAFCLKTQTLWLHFQF